MPVTATSLNERLHYGLATVFVNSSAFMEPFIGFLVPSFISGPQALMRPGSRSSKPSPLSPPVRGRRRCGPPTSSPLVCSLSSTRPRPPRCPGPSVSATEAVQTDSTDPRSRPRKPLISVRPANYPWPRNRCRNLATTSPTPKSRTPSSMPVRSSTVTATASPAAASAHPTAREERNKRLWGGAMMETLKQMGAPVQPAPGG
jgi:hypothetical protein